MVNAKEERVVVQFDKRSFPRGLKPRQFTALIGAAEAAPFQDKCKLHLYRMKRRVLRVWWGRADLQRRREILRAALICEIVGHGNPDPEELIGGSAHNVRGDDHHELAGVLLGVALGWRLEAGQLAEAGQAGQSRSFGF